MTQSDEPIGNGILNRLPPNDVARLMRDADSVALQMGDVLANPEEAIEFVYFPQTSVFSVLSVMTDGTAIEAGVIGREGFGPVAPFHGLTAAAERVVVQVPGDAVRVPTSIFRKALADMPQLDEALHRFMQALFTLAAQSSGCNRRHSVVQRCARWLLLTSDRVTGDSFPLTHVFLAQMLGVRRSSVTVAADALRAAGAIDYTRGKVHIVDRARLRQRSCDCYDIIKSTYDLLLEGTPTSSPLRGVQIVADEGVVSRHSPPRGIPSVADGALADFSKQIHEAQLRSELLRARIEKSTTASSDMLRAAEELRSTIEQLHVAEAELQAQVEALEEMRGIMETNDQRWSARLDGLPDGYIETDARDLIVHVNRTTEELLGRSRQSVMGKPVQTLIAPDDRSTFRQMMSAVRHGEETRWSGQLIVVHGAEQLLGVTATARPIGDLHGEGLRLGSAESGEYGGARLLVRSAHVRPAFVPRSSR